MMLEATGADANVDADAELLTTDHFLTSTTRVPAADVDTVLRVPRRLDTNIEDEPRSAVSAMSLNNSNVFSFLDWLLLWLSM
eukprot:m.85265 g.85265  ORF g.85265 m.85265 type:complete len:82 (-) comp15047_c1_seq5:165-410(-)